MALRFNRPEDKSWLQQLANVGSWLPSRRPKFRNRQTGTVVTLRGWQAEGRNPQAYAELQKSCGQIRLVDAEHFRKNYIRI